jgi:hypothetical protein
MTDPLVTDEFGDVLVKLAEAYGTTLTAGRVKLYAAALADVPLPVLRLACARAVRACRFFPTVAELLAQVQPTAEDAALVAWTGLQQAAADIGAYASLEVDDAAAAEALTTVFGSWPEFCALPDVAHGAKRAEFLAVYRHARRTARPGGRVLPGLCAQGAFGGDPAACWMGRLEAGGTVRPIRESEASDGHARAALGEAGAAGEGEAEARPRRLGGRDGGAGEGGAP